MNKPGNLHVVVARNGRHRAGQALVEYVLCMILFFGFFLLLLQFIALGNAKLHLNLATYYAARQAGLTADEDKVLRAAKAYWPYHSKKLDNLEIDYEAPEDNKKLGTEATVTVTGYYYLLNMPIIREVFGDLVDEEHFGAIALTARSVAVTEGSTGGEEDDDE